MMRVIFELDESTIKETMSILKDDSKRCSEEWHNASVDADKFILESVTKCIDMLAKINLLADVQKESHVLDYRVFTDDSKELYRL